MRPKIWLLGNIAVQWPGETTRQTQEFEPCKVSIDKSPWIWRFRVGNWKTFLLSLKKQMSIVVYEI